MGLAAATVTIASATAQTAPVPRRADRVLAIRFGVIDPPVVRQLDITVEAPTSNQQRTPKPLECSGLTHMVTTRGNAPGRLIITSDRHEHVLFTADVDPRTLAVEEPAPTVIIRNERELLADLESLTCRRLEDGRAYVYGICSLSNDPSGLPRPGRRQMMRIAVDDAGHLQPQSIRVIRADHLRHRMNELFVQLHIAPYRAYFAAAEGQPSNTYRWGNVEGMAFSPDGRSLVCGMRNPTIDDRAIVFVVSGVHRAFDTLDAMAMSVTDAMSLDLGGRGVSDLAWDPLTRGYLITAARSNGPKLDDDQPYPPDQLDGAVYWWSGRRDEPPVLFARVEDMLPEAICRIDNSPLIVIGTDEGDVSEGRPQRQSRLILMVFTGLELSR